MNHDQAQELGRFLKAHRTKLGYSVRALGRMCGFDMTTIMRLEQGAFARPDPDKLKAVAIALELPPAEIFARAGYPVTTDLPSLRPYLRARYGDLPTAAVQEMETYFENLAARYGIDPDGPAPGEDEHEEDL